MSQAHFRFTIYYVGLFPKSPLLFAYFVSQIRSHYKEEQAKEELAHAKAHDSARARQTLTVG
jgi:hypothetical protein